MEFCVVSFDKARLSAGRYKAPQFGADFRGGIGAFIPSGGVVLDIDCTSPHARLFVDKMIKERPGLFITKTSKAGGFHLWFKTKDKIKRNTGNLISIFGWKFDILTGTNNYIVMPDNFPNRMYYNGFKNLKELSDGWESYNEYISEHEISRIMPFVHKTNDHLTPLELKEGSRNAGLIEWLGWCANQGVHPDTMSLHSDVLAGITGLQEREISSTILSSLSKYSARDEKETTDNKIPAFYGDALPEIQDALVAYIKENNLFSYDESTGIYTCNIGGYKGKILSQAQFVDLMHLHFAKKLWYVNRDSLGIKTGVREVPVADRATLFKTLAPMISFNSRKLIYDNIPKWDGVERINDFMKNYYDCDANPNFTWLLLTSIVGKLKEPEQCYVPYFFDFVGNKGVGKTLLPQRLVGDLYAMLQYGRSYDDIFVNIYNANAVVAIDDECTMVGSGFNKLSYDQWKQFVTAKVDRFSRKNAQPESHPRSFVVVRTSNDTKTGYALDERRQIIFESKLPKNGCRIRYEDVPDSFFQQLLAEAKVYYERFGTYKLNQSDWECVEQQLADSFNSEDQTYVEILDYVQWCITKARVMPGDNNGCFIPKGGKYYINWNTYHKWCENKMTKPVRSIIFWNSICAIQAKEGLVYHSDTDRICLKGSMTKFAELNMEKEETEDSQKRMKIKRVSVKEFFKDDKDIPADETKPRASPLAQELNATYCKFDDTNEYHVNELIKYCPDEVQAFFIKHSNCVDKIVPTIINVNGLDITYGIGGIHSAIKWYRGADLMYLDVKSLYPNLMAKYHLLSRAVPDPSVYEHWLSERLRLKQMGNPLADELKLKLNSVYGLMKAKWCALYDPYMASSVSVLGQIVMTILITGLQEEGCEIINANTDGLIIKPMGNWNSICTKWEEMLDLKLERKKIKELEQSDVNNYRAVFEDGKVVNKGAKYKE